MMRAISRNTRTSFAKSGAVNGPMIGLLAGIALAIVGAVFLIQGLSAASEGYPMSAFGVEVESALPGVILLVIAAAIAIGSLVALGGGGSRRGGSRNFGTKVVSWNHMPLPGVKTFGNPPALPSHRAELAGQGLEAFRLNNGEWAVRRMVR